jgi:hypothetical protein
MGSNSINLMLRFILELVALASAGIWGWKQTDGWFRFVLAIGIPICVAAIWGTFAVVDDPSRSGTAIVPVPGIVRLGVELSVFAFGTWALYNMGASRLSIAFGIVVVLHYIISYDRILWLMSQ